MAVNTNIKSPAPLGRAQTVFAVLLLVIAMLITIVAMPTQRTSASGLTKVTSCQGLTVKKYGNEWWTYQNNTRVSYTGLAKNDYGWWRTVNGKVDFSYTGIAKNDYGWYRVVKGKVRFDNTGVYRNEYGWWYCQSGKVNFNYTGVKSNDYGYWRIEGGKVNFHYSGLAPDENGVWYYIENGKVNFQHEGLVMNDNGTWYVKGGKVQFGYSGDYRGYTIQNGKVIKTPNIPVSDDTTTTTATTAIEDVTTTTQSSGATKYDNSVLTDQNGNVVLEDTGIVVDISKWNGDINFTTLKNSGVKGVMMRAAYSTTKDIKFEYNSAQCEKVGLDYGVYQFVTFHYGSTKSAAMTKAKTQADALINILKGKNVTGYVCLDLELESGYKLVMTPQELTDVANYYFSLIEAAGYKPMLYCSVSWLQNNMIESQIHVPLWIAYYYDTGSYDYPKTGYGTYMDSVSGKITMWQFTDKGNGTKYGTESDYVDLNRLYHSFTGATS